MTRIAILLVVPAVGLGACGCSTFDRDWKAAAAAGPGTALEGRWEGTWLSAVNGHTGGLRSIVTRRESGTYEARYHATYGCCFSFEYTVEMAAEADGGGYKLRGSADLGWLAGGVYRYETTVAGDVLHSTYAAEADHGTFDVVRVK